MAIEIRVESNATGGLQIIEGIPAVRPCHLEGKNGIGKSVLIRLLMLASGQQPYLSEHASWNSLKRLVGGTVLTISGLRGDFSEARVRLTPDAWPALPSTEVGDWLGELTVDGKPAPLHQLFEVFQVVQLSGTEKLADTLTQHAVQLGAAIGHVEGQLDAIEDARVELGELGRSLGMASPLEAERDETTLTAAVEERRTIKANIETALPRAADLGQASALQALVDSGTAAKHSERLKELRQQLEVARVQLAKVERDHERAITALDKGTDAQRQAAKLERRLAAIQKLLDRLLVKQQKSSDLLLELHIEPETELLSGDQQQALATATEEARAQYHGLKIHAARAHRSGAENQVLDDVRVILNDAVEQGLGDMILAHVDDLDLTVLQVRSGLGFLVDVGDEVLELHSASEGVASLEDLNDVFVTRASLTAEQVQVRATLEELEPDITAHDGLRAAAIDARAAIDAASSHVRALNVEIGIHSRGVLGGPEEVADIEQLVRDLLEKHNVSGTDLGANVLEAQAETIDLQRREQALGELVESLNDRASRRRLVREGIRRQAEPGGSNEWVGELLRRTSKVSDAPGADWPEEAWAFLSVTVDDVGRAYDELTRQVRGLHAIASEADLASRSELGAAVRGAVESAVRQELTEGPIADALFDGGEVLRVSPDGDTWTVTWRTPEGELRTRPLTAFSSGQQALGFMRARLQVIANQPQANRLVFLDEFGAFVSADRRRPLADLLTSHALKSLAEDVVVVLPLQADYEEELTQTTGALHELYARRAESVARRGYFTERFDG